MNQNRLLARRQFVRFLAASPLAAAVSARGQDLWSENYGLLHYSPLDFADYLIASADEATNTPEFEKVAARKLDAAHYGYVASGAGDGSTVLANRKGYDSYYFRAHRMAAIANPDIRGSIFGQSFSSPIMIAPCGGMGAMHVEGESAVSRASSERGMIHMHSTMATYPIEAVAAGRQAPLWYQLYAIAGYDYAASMVERAIKAGSSAVMVTVDTPARGTPEFQNILTRLDPRDCTECHGEVRTIYHKPMIAGAGINGSTMASYLFSWELIGQLKADFDVPVLVKGIETAEDSELSIQAGADGVVLSNHGGRGLANGRATVLSLPDMVAAVNGRIPIIMDGGVRRGDDALKALLLGANGVGVGRAYLWGLAAFGYEGAAKVMDILNSELKAAMKNLGIANLDALSPDFIGRY